MVSKGSLVLLVWLVAVSALGNDGVYRRLRIKKVYKGPTKQSIDGLSPVSNFLSNSSTVVEALDKKIKLLSVDENLRKRHTLSSYLPPPVTTTTTTTAKPYHDNNAYFSENHIHHHHHHDSGINTTALITMLLEQSLDNKAPDSNSNKFKILSLLGGNGLLAGSKLGANLKLSYPIPFCQFDDSPCK